jgi:hypothetical protein
VKVPIHDWQFWAVTAAALAALAYVLREVLPAKWSPFKSRRKGKSASLTIEGKSPGARKDCH